MPTVRGISHPKKFRKNLIKKMFCTIIVYPSPMLYFNPMFL